MIANLVAATLTIGLATASLRAINTTDTAVFTIVPNIPVIANSGSHLDVPPHDSNVPSTYVPAQTTPSIQDNGTTGSMTLNAPRIEITLSSLETPSSNYPTTYGVIGTTSASMPPASDTETSHAGSSPEALTSFSTIAQPTYSSYPVYTAAPVALSSYASVAQPTLAPASPQALTMFPSVAGPTFPSYTPAIVHTEIPAESLDTPPGQTYASSSFETVSPVGPAPGAGDGEGTSFSAVPTKVMSIPTTVVTVAPDVVISVGGYQSTIDLASSGQPMPSTLVTTVPEQAITMSGGQVLTMPAAVYTLTVLPLSASSSVTVSGATPKIPDSDGPNSTALPVGAGGGSGSDGGSGSGDQEGAAAKMPIESWVYSSLAMAVAIIALL